MRCDLLCMRLYRQPRYLSSILVRENGFGSVRTTAGNPRTHVRPGLPGVGDQLQTEAELEIHLEEAGPGQRDPDLLERVEHEA